MPQAPTRVQSSSDASEQLALRFVARHDRTTRDVAAFLQRKGVAASRLAAVVRKLTRQGVLDDRRYAREWLARTLARRPMGRARLEAELAARGIDTAVAREAIEHACGERSETEWAEDALRRRASRGLGRHPYRDAAALRRYGFSEETIERVLGSLEES